MGDHESRDSKSKPVGFHMDMPNALAEEAKASGKILPGDDAKIRRIQKIFWAILGAIILLFWAWLAIGR